MSALVPVEDVHLLLGADIGILSASGSIGVQLALIPPGMLQAMSAQELDEMDSESPPEGCVLVAFTLRATAALRLAEAIASTARESLAGLS